MQVFKVNQEGLLGILSELQLANQYVRSIEEYLAIITSSGQISVDARVQAYKQLAALEKSVRFLALDQNVLQEFAKELEPKLDSYLAQIPVDVPTPGSGGMIPLYYKGRPASVLDIVNAINSGDASQDFSINAHLNEAWRSIHTTDWFTDSDDVKYITWAVAVGSPHDSGCDNGAHGENLSWKVVGCSGCNLDWDLYVKGSVSMFYAGGVGMPDNTKGATKSAYDALFNFFRGPGI
jgi:hypothetical protein